MGTFIIIIIMIIIMLISDWSSGTVNGKDVISELAIES